MVCSQMPPIYGGAGTQAALLARTLSRLGWDVTALTLDQSGVGSATEDGVHYLRLLKGAMPVSRLSRAVTTAVLGLGASMQILKARPSVVHIHGAYWWSIPPAIIGRIMGAVVVVKLTRDGEDDAHTVYSKRIGRLPVGRLYGLSLTMAHHVVVLNEYARQIAAHEGLGRKTQLVSNGVAEEKFRRTAERRASARTSRGLTDEDRVVLFVGYLVKHKGVVDLLHAWRRLDNRAAHLWLVGPFEGFYRELGDEIPVMIDQLASEGFRVTKLGQVGSTELAELYWAADIFTLPSYSEGMPNSLAEAVVAGCHVVATKIPGITDVMGAEYPDLVQPGDVEGLANHLREAISAVQELPPEATEKLGIAKVARIYEQIYAQKTKASR